MEKCTTTYIIMKLTVDGTNPNVDRLTFVPSSYKDGSTRENSSQAFPNVRVHRQNIFGENLILRTSLVSWSDCEAFSI